MGKTKYVIGFVVTVAIAGLCLIVVYWLDKSNPVVSISRYSEMRSRIALQAPALTKDVLPEQIPGNATDARMWAQCDTNQKWGTLLLSAVLPSEEIDQIVIDARRRSVWRQVDWRATSPGFYQPAWNKVLPNAQPAHDLPGNYEAILLGKEGLGMELGGVNGGLLVNRESRTIIWWIYHRHVSFN